MTPVARLQRSPIDIDASVKASGNVDEIFAAACDRVGNLFERQLFDFVAEDQIASRIADDADRLA